MLSVGGRNQTMTRRHIEIHPFNHKEIFISESKVTALRHPKIWWINAGILMAALEARRSCNNGFPGSVKNPVDTDTESVRKKQ